MMLFKRQPYYSQLKFLWGVFLGGMATLVASPSQAQEIFGNTGIQFDVDTVIEFEFVESNGAYQSTFGVIDLTNGQKTPLLIEVKPSDIAQDVSRPSTYTDDTGSTNRRDFIGTPGNTVPQPLAEFEFKANRNYAFYLESTLNGRPAGILYSTNSQNPGTNQQTVFEGGLPALASGGTLIRWDDTGSVLVRQELEDRDFDDFVIRAGGHIPCPYETNENQPENLDSLIPSDRVLASACNPQRSQPATPTPES